VVDARTTRERRSRSLLLPLLLLAACLIPYASGLSGDFTYDDKAIVRDNVRIQSPDTLGQIFETSYFGGSRGSGTAYRPLLLLSYAVQWWLHGRNATLFHAVNLLFHAGATLLLWRLCLRLRLPEAAAAAAALLFAVHPIHVEAVTSLVGRGETQAAVLVLLYLHVALRLPESTKRRVALLGAALALYSLALLTKEIAATAPALAFLCFSWLAEGSTVRRLRAALRRGLALYGGSALVLAGYFALRAGVLGGLLRAGRTGIFEVENPLSALPTLGRVGNACLILIRYVGRMLFPLRLSADESAWSIRPLPTASVLAIGSILLLALAMLAALARPRSAAAFGFLFFLVAILPASNIPFPIGTIFAERVAYLPSAGLCLAAGALLAGAADRLSALAPARAWAVAAVALLLAVRTAVRGPVWRNDQALFENSVRVAPGSAKNHYNLGYIRAEHLRWREALEAYGRATQIYPGYWDAWAGKGKCERRLGKLADAQSSYERALVTSPSYENGFFGLGLVLEERGRDREALETYRRGLVKQPRSIPLALRAATLESRLGDESARRSWERALKNAPRSLPTRFGFARWLAGRGDREGARRQLRWILARAPRDAPALRLLARLDGAAGRDFAEALALEKVFRITRWSGDLLPLLDAASRTPAYRTRFEHLRPRLERDAPWAFRFARSYRGELTATRAAASSASAGGG
jgi:tetratricopeptide (TPR) repeat protein